jgi:hypothetical protein
VTWSISVRLLEGNVAIAMRDFLHDYAVLFAERQACGMAELLVSLTKADALRLADALQVLGTRALVDNDACLTVRPGGAS